jgi:hypothetical protein
MVKEMGDNTKRGAECSEHPAPQKTSRSTVTKTEGTSNYDTKPLSPKEETCAIAAEGAYSRVITAAHALFEPSQTVELRAIFRNGRIDSGYFDDFSILAEAAAILDKRDDVAGV